MKSTIRGLDARVRYAIADLHQKIELNPPTSFHSTVSHPAFERAAACRQAQALGYAECLLEVPPPVLFQPVPELLAAWRVGYTSRIDSMESWREQCQRIWQETLRACGGGGYEWFQRSFSSSVDHLLTQRVPPFLHEQALATIADLDYLTPAQRQAQEEAMEADGFCCHGIERDCCPAGCGT